MSPIVYFRIEGFDKDMFACPSGLGSMSTNACSKSYQEAMSATGLREGRRVTCRSCHVGAHHSGIRAGSDSVSRLLGGTCCARCHKDARRLIRGSICISCYNREREVLIGKNAKGNRPQDMRPVFSSPVTCVIDSGAKVQVRMMDKVSSTMEAFLSILRIEQKQVWFGWTPSSEIIRN